MIEMKNVSKWYGSFQVLNDCSTSIAKGEVVVVCGPSGSGKSTLIKTINALEPIQKGEIWVNGTAYEVALTGNSWVISAEALGITGGIKDVVLEVSGPTNGKDAPKFTVEGAEWQSMPKDVNVDFDVNVKGTDGDGDPFDGGFNVSNGHKPTEPTNPAGDPPDVSISLAEEARHTEVTYTKGDSSITVGDGGVVVDGMGKTTVTAVTYDMGVGTQSHAVVINQVGYNHTTVKGTTNVVGTFRLLEPVFAPA